MSKTRNIRVLLLSVSTIVLCIALMIGATYAWFTDVVIVDQHLVAGNLDITLKRTNLTWYRLGAGGSMETGQSGEVVDFSAPTHRNVFDFTANTLIVPCTWYEATMQVENNRSVTFGYWIEMIPTGGTSSELARQLEVTVTTYDALGNVTNTVTKSAGESLVIGGNGQNGNDSYVGILETNDPAQTFTVKVEFPDLGDTNNAAQTQSLSFDLIVRAIQVLKD